MFPGHKQFHLVLFLCLAQLGLAPQAPAEDFYVRQGSSGNGSTWGDAYGSLPSTLQRGSTYWIADGSYGGYTFDDAENGTQHITIKKATTSDHGTTSGWMTDYGDGQASIGDLVFRTDYWTLDGNKPDGYGFVLNSSSPTRAVLLGPYGGPRGDHVVIRSLSIDLSSAPSSVPSGRGFYMVSCTDITIDNVEVKNLVNDVLFMDNCSDITVSNSHFHTRRFVTSGPSEHADLIESLSTDNLVFLNNSVSWDGQGIFFNNRGTQPLSATVNSNWTVAGNIFTAPGSGVSAKGVNGVDGNSSQGPGGCSNLLIYNNVFHNLNSVGVFSGASHITGNAVNNIILDCTMGGFYGTHDYNYFDFSLGSDFGEAHGQLGGDPFFNAAGGDYRLIAPTEPGLTMPPPYNVDRLGNPRGADGVWDRGAFEFAGAPDTTPPTKPQGVEATAITDTRVVVTWMASSDASPIGGYKVFRDGEEIGMTATTSFTDTGLAPLTTYFYRVMAIDVATNQSELSDEVQATTPVPDTIPPDSPTSLTAIARGAFEVELAWTPPDDPALGSYAVYRDGFEIATTSDPAYSDSSVQPLTQYTYTVLAFDLADNPSEPSASASVITDPPPPLPDGLIAAYGFDEGAGNIAQDISGNGHHGTRNAPAWSTNGHFSGALEFDGADDRVEVESFDVTGGTGLTLAAWIKADDFEAYDGRIITKSNPGGEPEAHYWMLSTMTNNGIKLRFRLKTNGQTTTFIAPQGTLTPGVWTHAAAVWDGNTMMLYKDGTLVGSTPKTGTLSMAPTVPVWIGSQRGQLASTFDGLIDEVYVFNRALAPQEIQDLMNSSKLVAAALPTWSRYR